MEIIEWFWESTEDALSTMAEAVANAFGTVLTLLIVSALRLGEGVLSLLPDVTFPFTEGQIASAMVVVMAWDVFVPVTESAIMIFASMGFVLTYGIGRFIISLIPTVG